MSGLLETRTALSNGWLNITKTFTSPDLVSPKCAPVGGVTIQALETYRVGRNEIAAYSRTTTEKATLYVLRQDEIPLSTSSANAAVTPTSIYDGNGLIYPQWEYGVYYTGGGGCTTRDRTPVYVQADPIAFGYEFKPLSSINWYLTYHNNWGAAACVSDKYIYDFTGFGWKVEDLQLTKGNPDPGCFTSGRYHARFWTMANGRVVAGVHYEFYCTCNPLTHAVTDYEGAEHQLYLDEIGQYYVRYDSYWLNNYVGYPYNDGWATQAF